VYPRPGPSEWRTFGMADRYPSPLRPNKASYFPRKYTQSKIGGPGAMAH